MLALARELGVPGAAGAGALAPGRRRRRRAGAAAGARRLRRHAGRASTCAPTRPVYVDLRLRHAAFGYLPPSLDGARTLSLATARFGVARSAGATDQRTVDMTIRLDEQGGGRRVATEELTGWPALEWAELVDRFGADARGCARTSSSAGWACSSRARACVTSRSTLPRRRRAARAGAPARPVVRRARALLVREPAARRARRARDATLADVLPLAAGPAVRRRAAALDDAGAGLRRAVPPDGDRGAAARGALVEPARRRAGRRRAQGRPTASSRSATARRGRARACMRPCARESTLPLTRVAPGRVRRRRRRSAARRRPRAGGDPHPPARRGGARSGRRR